MSSREFNQRTGVARKAARDGPVYITDRGRPSYVLLSYDHYRELIKGEPHFAGMLRRTPGIGDIAIEFPRLDGVAHPAVFD